MPAQCRAVLLQTRGLPSPRPRRRGPFPSSAAGAETCFLGLFGLFEFPAGLNSPKSPRLGSPSGLVVSAELPRPRPCQRQSGWARRVATQRAPRPPATRNRQGLPLLPAKTAAPAGKDCRSYRQRVSAKDCRVCLQRLLRSNTASPSLTVAGPVAPGTASVATNDRHRGRSLTETEMPPPRCLVLNSLRASDSDL